MEKNAYRYTERDAVTLMTTTALVGQKPDHLFYDTYTRCRYIFYLLAKYAYDPYTLRASYFIDYDIQSRVPTPYITKTITGERTIVRS